MVDPMIRRLEGPEIAAYDILDPDLARKVRIVKVPALVPGAAAMTLGRWIFVTDDSDRGGSRELIAHELVHVRQYAEMGMLSFLHRYLTDYGRERRQGRSHREAYLAIPAEQEARRDAAAWLRRRTSRFR